MCIIPEFMGVPQAFTLTFDAIGVNPTTVAMAAAKILVIVLFVFAMLFSFLKIGHKKSTLDMKVLILCIT